ncbi:MAG: GGDEF domain-containing protein [Eubacterium sp.]|jgi:diguanylate cyclase (GGDEF)-like protein|nr:GGDEF domain-containing protein [Eubacterium sp.]
MNIGQESPGSMQELKQERWDEAELLRDSRILEHTHSFIVEYNFKTKQCYIDPAQKRHVYGDWAGWAKDKRRDYSRIALKEDIPKLQALFDFDGLKAGDSKSAAVRLYVKPHTYEWFRVSLICYGEQDGDIERMLITFTNAEQELETVQKLKFLLARDPLTHMPNLDSFMQMTENLIQANPDQSYAVIRMDIDKFRMINQMYGTKEGDNILRYIGVKIQEWVGPLEDEENDSTYGRISSDMFCVCMPANAGNIQEIIDFIQASLRAYPIKFEMVMSFGVYITCEADRAEHVPVSTLMDRAVSAQRTVKNSYVNHVAYYDNMIRKREVAEQIIVSEMKKALETDQFQVYLQPKCEMDTGRIIGSEALVRWIHPSQGIISPGEFIPVFEKNGFISELDYYMLRSSCQIIQRWIKEGVQLHPISVNVSRTDLYNPDLLEQIKACVDEYGVPHDLIEFELTESAFVSDNMQLYNLARLLQENQFRVLMDDFGSGYSSLNSLREIPVDVLKIDLKFLPPSQDDTRGNVILQSIVEMAKRLGLDVIVEGVETTQQAEFLLSIGCRNAQGYYFYKPMPVSEYERCLNEPKETGLGGRTAGGI